MHIHVVGHGLKQKICVGQMEQLLEQDLIQYPIGPNTITVALTGWPF